MISTLLFFQQCYLKVLLLRLITILVDRTIDVVFSRFRVFSFTITLRKKPKGVTRRQRWITRQRESMRVTPLSFCLKVIVNEILKSWNLESWYQYCYLTMFHCFIDKLYWELFVILFWFKPCNLLPYWLFYL